MDGDKLAGSAAQPVFDHLRGLTCDVDLAGIQAISFAHAADVSRCLGNMCRVVVSHGGMIKSLCRLMQPGRHRADLLLHFRCELRLCDVMSLQPGQQGRHRAVGEGRLRKRTLHMQAFVRQVSQEGQLGPTLVRVMIRRQPLCRPVDAQQILPIRPIHGVLVLLDELCMDQLEGCHGLCQQRIHRLLLSSAARAATMPSTAALMMPPA